MGASIPENNTHHITTWISKVKCKKMAVKRQRRTNLLVEAILSHALTRAQQDLQAQRRQRLERWKEIKDSLAAESKAAIDKDLISLDNFMSQLSQVKIPVVER